ncbi:putative RNA methyltransferase [Sulfurivermis fontis]|uniref:putative RNA methyltransferase n=1 Tax=Sulfurivermis fontis TaxID=1972068 RepID=UPI000FDB1526|nr:methyltransferase domain-containing protein [Sulfurivermis fontis]
MHKVKAVNLACPLDGLPLTQGERQLCCPAGHSFDIARHGYVNLLPVQNKKSREPGDSTEMVEARRRFLNAGFYRPIADQLTALMLQSLPDTEPCIVDAGCGEGYYLDQVNRVLAANGRDATLIGLDIAKPAVIAACRRNRQLTWLVASNNNPAIMPKTVDLILCLFGFPVYPAFARMLKPGGRLLLVDAGPDHLLELREVIYPEVRKSPPPAIDKAQQAGFKLVDSRTLRYHTAALNHEQIADLLRMTPHLYRASSVGKEAAARLSSLRLTVDVVFRILGRSE